MNVLRSIWQDLRARKLLPVAGLLLLAIVAVPVVLSSSGSTPPPAPLPSSGAPVAAGLPAVSDASGAGNAAPGGRARNPFAPSSGGSSATTTTTTTHPLPTSVATPTPSGPTGSGGSTGSGSPTASSPTTTPSGPAGSGGGTPPKVPSKLPTPKPKHPTAALSADQSYDVSLAITNSTGGVDTINPLERLSLLPSASQPLLVELGVLRGGSRVLFAVQPGTVPSGPGECIPGPIHCEILSLAQEQTEKLSLHTASGQVEVALFAVTGISAVKHSSAAAALRARAQESAAGRRVLAHSSLSALSLFHYATNVGAVVDLRNLTLRDS